MKKINVKDISTIIESLCIEACCFLPDEVINSYKNALNIEKDEFNKNSNIYIDVKCNCIFRYITKS